MLDIYATLMLFGAIVSLAFSLISAAQKSETLANITVYGAITILLIVSANSFFIINEIKNTQLEIENLNQKIDSLEFSIDEMNNKIEGS